MSKIIGIDLGTTNSCVAVLEGGDPVVIPNAEGNRTTPSVVGFAKDGERLVGSVAKRQAIANADRTVSSIKREMGSDYKVNIDGKTYSPQEISAMILKKLKEDAESYLGEKVTEAVITVPAYFTDSQRQATKDAGKIAGLDVKRIINEPTAAALAYGLDKVKDSSQKVFVYDLGGGTFDISILEIGDSCVEVLATAGDNRLGGDDFDHKIMDYLIEQFKKDNGIDLSKDKLAMQRLKDVAEKAKIELSSLQKTTISLPFIANSDNGPVHLEYEMTRGKFDSLTSSLVQRTIDLSKRALKDAGLTPDKLSKVILVGGSTRIPAVVEAVRQVAGKEPFKGINPDECVAIGAAIQAGVLAGEVKDVLLLDVTPLSLGIETLGGICTKLIERNTTIPTKKSQIFSTAQDNQPSVDIHVLQGERDIASANKTLARFELTGIPPAPRGIPQIEVTFDIDANGIVHVSAKDLGTNKEQHVTITASSNLTEDQINDAIKDAEKIAEEDKKRKEVVDAKNHADIMVGSIEKVLSESGDKISEEEKEALNKHVEEVKEAAKGDNIDDIKAKTAELEKISGEVFTKLYQQTAGAGTAESSEGVKVEDMGDNNN